MVQKRVLVPDQIRRVPKRFGWIDHRLLAEGYLARLSPTALNLYLFLILVGDHQGLSFYSDLSIAKHLPLRPNALALARRELIANHLLAWSPPLYQVLAIKPSLPSRSTASSESPRSGVPQQIGEVLRSLLSNRDTSS